MRNFLIWLGVLAFAIFAPVLVAVAAEVVATAPGETVVTVPYGNWLDLLLAHLADPTSVAWTALAGVVAWLLSRLPAPLAWLFRMAQVEQLLARAAQAGINSTRGAVAGRTLDVNVGSEVIAKAANYAIEHASAALVEWMGGKHGIQEKLLARVPLDESASGGEVLAKANNRTTPQNVDSLSGPI